MKSCTITKCNELTSIVFEENSFIETQDKLNISHLHNLRSLKFKENSFQHVQTVVLEGKFFYHKS